jgi:hypothetical protein
LVSQDSSIHGRYHNPPSEPPLPWTLGIFGAFRQRGGIFGAMFFRRPTRSEDFTKLPRVSCVPW